MTEPNLIKGQLRMEVIGEFWVATYETSSKSIPLASIKESLLTEEIELAFTEVMKMLVSDIVEAEVGCKPNFGTLQHYDPEKMGRG